VKSSIGRSIVVLFGMLIGLIFGVPAAFFLQALAVRRQRKNIAKFGR
jgi:tetrahydromethanopterin S-methyltransferase subunit G